MYKGYGKTNSVKALEEGG